MSDEESEESPDARWLAANSAHPPSIWDEPVTVSENLDESDRIQDLEREVHSLEQRLRLAEGEAVRSDKDTVETFRAAVAHARSTIPPEIGMAPLLAGTLESLGVAAHALGGVRAFAVRTDSQQRFPGGETAEQLYALTRRATSASIARACAGMLELGARLETGQHPDYSDELPLALIASAAAPSCTCKEEDKGKESAIPGCIGCAAESNLQAMYRRHHPESATEGAPEGEPQTADLDPFRPPKTPAMPS